MSKSIKRIITLCLALCLILGGIIINPIPPVHADGGLYVVADFMGTADFNYEWAWCTFANGSITLILGGNEDVLTGDTIRISKKGIEDKCKELGMKCPSYFTINGKKVNYGDSVKISKSELRGSEETIKYIDIKLGYSDEGSNTSSETTTSKKYSNEWVNGKWYNADGSQTYKGTIKWKSNSKGWWIEDSAGWYPKSQWQKIDGKWYYFCSDGYMDYSEYRDGCWIGSDGAWVESYSGGKWYLDSTGWWYSDSSGWYPANQWLWIDGTNYHFNAKGYCTNP